MLSIYRLYCAKQLLKGCDTTITALMPDAPDMLLAQRDLLYYEVEHFRDESKKFIRNALTFVIIFVTIYFYFRK
jgi:hypothetical protein